MKKGMVAVIILLFFAACTKDKTIDSTTGNLLLLNEGTFNMGNAEISIYDRQTKQISNALFYQKNTYPLGDVAQSVFQYKKELFVIVNNSAKIEVLDAATFRVKRTISIPNSSPRYMQLINDSIAVVTELYADKIWHINIYTGNIVNTTTTNGWTEQIVAASGKLFFVQKKRYNSGASENAILIFNQSNFQKIPLAEDIAAMVGDGNNQLYLLLLDMHQAAKIVKLNTQTLALQTVYIFAANEKPTLLLFNKTTQQLNFVMNGVYALETNTIHKVIDLPTGNYYAFNVTADGDYFISDAIDFVQRSKVYQYNSVFSLVNTFYAGVNTNQIVEVNE